MAVSHDIDRSLMSAIQILVGICRGPPKRLQGVQGDHPRRDARRLQSTDRTSFGRGGAQTQA